MSVVWIVLGGLILAFTLLDSFLTILNYNERGLFLNRIARLEWLAIRAITRRLSGQMRRRLLRQVTGIILLTTIGIWLAGILLGFAFIYNGALGLGHVTIDHGSPGGFAGALYLSMGMFSTAGAADATAGAPWVAFVTVAQALLSILMLSLIISFLVNVFGAIRALRDLCLNFTSPNLQEPRPLDMLEPYFPSGQARGLDLYLEAILTNFNAYTDAIRDNRSAYYFQSGHDRFSLPDALAMIGQVVSGLRWGLPSDSEAAAEPHLIRIDTEFSLFRRWLNHVHGFTEGEMPTPVGPDQFAAAVGNREQNTDVWVDRFLRLCDRMAELTDSAAPIDPEEAYNRYLEWLAFGYRAEELYLSVARDLDFRANYRSTPLGA